MKTRKSASKRKSVSTLSSVETSGVLRVTTGFTLERAAIWNHSEMVKEATFLWVDGTLIDFSTLQTVAHESFSNPAGTRGSNLAGAPPFQGNIRGR